MNQPDKQAFETVKLLFKNDKGDPFEMTKGQIDMFRAIYERQHPRTQIEAYTQYGKSDVISMAILLRATTFPERWPIIAPSVPKTRIIMEKVIKHVFENEYTRGKFAIDKSEAMERIKRQRSQTRLTFKVDSKGGIGEIFVLSAGATRTSQDAGDILMGWGAPNIVEDESGLIPDQIQGKIHRMLGGFKDNFRLKIGNTFGRGHFYKTHSNPLYKVINIPYTQGIAEGRQDQKFFDEARTECNDPILFGILYECKFPSEAEIDVANWIILLREEEIRDAMARKKVEPRGIRRMGVDISRGGRDSNVWYLRTDNFARKIKKNKDPDLMSVAKTTKELMKEEHIAPENVYLDDVGYGGGVVDRLKDLGYEVNPVVAQATPENKEEFANVKAEMYSEGAKWLREGGVVEEDEDWAFQLIKTRWKKNSSGRMLIKPKQDLRREGLPSPDDLDAFMLTFAKPTIIKMQTQEATGSALPYYPDLGF